MSRFAVYRNPDGDGYLLDVQADLLSHLNTRIVVPLLPRDVAPTPAKVLNPVFEVDGQSVVMATQFLAAVPKKMLSRVIANTENRRSEIKAALDLLFQGF